MINFLIYRRYNFIDLCGQGLMMWGFTKYNDWTWLLIIIPFSMASALLESIERVNNGGKK